ncbi:bifunctional 4-hydroxy-2-oxoglutarate aldolase/2-dehydro-3-deoxy-phosphogluconate aldolase [Amycolatopsis sp. NPDC051371]|uniref:bifunctional 4-hydroxy-2-oxoglutarate aldolase/2-dehydro-3-deoxy-phosphogluconate aldolase n=1 Tax=Amycolatopsis sp. NPDC051371 TaxID=3155800 RepID=UPI0034302E8C
MNAVIQAIRESRLVAILRGGEAGHLLDGSRVLVDEGVRVLEFPLTGPDVLDVVTAAAEALDGGAFVGAGTVRTLDDARRAIDAGARFLVSPALSVPVVEYASARDIAVLPGTFTPTEIDTALQAGAELVKLFPASSHQPEFLRQLHAPLPQAGVVPTGGVDLAAARSWLAAGAVAVGVGSPLTGECLVTGDFAALRTRARTWLDGWVAGPVPYRTRTQR